MLNLEKAVESRKSAQATDSSSYMKKVLITNKVTTHFFITLSKSVACTSFSHSTAFSRLKPLLLLLFGILLPSNSQAEQSPQFAVASSLQFVMPEIMAAFKQNAGYAPRITYGSSGNFRRQITQGAPFQLFMSADESYVKALSESGITLDEGRVYALGRLAVVVPDGSALVLSEDLSFLAKAVEQNTLIHFAIANPDHAPYGRAAREALTSLGLWSGIQPFLIKGENASQAMQFALSGSSQGGLLPLALARSPAITGTSRVLAISSSLHKPIRQRMVLLKGAGERTKAFYQFISSKEVVDIFKAYGYEIPSTTSPDDS